MDPAKSFVLFLLIMAALSEVSMASNIRIPAGSALVFNYDKRLHNVLRVTEQNFHACNATNPIAEYNSGDDGIIFRKPGRYHFISGVPGDCESGLKLPVEVVSLSVTSTILSLTPGTALSGAFFLLLVITFCITALPVDIDKVLRVLRGFDINWDYFDLN